MNATELAQKWGDFSISLLSPTDHGKTAKRFQLEPAGTTLSHRFHGHDAKMERQAAAHRAKKRLSEQRKALLSTPTCFHNDYVEWRDNTGRTGFSKVPCTKPADHTLNTGWSCADHYPQDVAPLKFSASTKKHIYGTDVLRLEEREIARLRASKADVLDLTAGKDLSALAWLDSYGVDIDDLVEMLYGTDPDNE